MKKVFFLTSSIVFFAAVIFLSCSGAAAGNTTAGNTSSGNASFSAKIDGVNFSSDKVSDNLNAAFRVKGGYINKDFAPYDDDGVTVTINSISATRVSGTFSGTYKVEAGWPKAKPTIQVTDGKFDIPFSTSAQWKKMYQAE